MRSKDVESRPMIARFYFLALVCVPLALPAQAPGVPVYPEGPGAKPLASIRTQARKLKADGALLSQADFAKQTNRKSCTLTLPPANTTKLESRELWQRARKAHIRVGWNYLCKECKKWHVELSGGYAIAKDTVVTCAHVTGDGHDEDMTEGYLIAVDEDDHVMPVTEVLAINRATDTAILKLKTDSLQPLPLSTDVVPGDPVVCFSDPLDRRGVYSTGIVERFMQRLFLRKEELSRDERKHIDHIEAPVWVQVSTAWAQGSSGSAVLDLCGNVIGHVSEVQTMLDDTDPGLDPEEPPAEKPITKTDDKPKAESQPEMKLDETTEPPGTVIVFHDAIAASNVKALIKAQ